MLSLAKRIQTQPLTLDTTAEYYEKVDGDIRLRMLVRESLDRRFDPFEVGRRIAARENKMNDWRIKLNLHDDYYGNACVAAVVALAEMSGCSEQDARDFILWNRR